jgi:hypothetical protein
MLETLAAKMYMYIHKKLLWQFQQLASASLLLHCKGVGWGGVVIREQEEGGDQEKG